MTALQNFVDKVGPVVSAAFLNEVDLMVNQILGSATTNVAARAALMSDLPLEVINGGTGARTALLARLNLTADAPLEIANGGTGARTAAAALVALGVNIATLGPIINYQSAGEVLAGVVPTNYAYRVGDVRRYGGACDGGVTPNQTAFQNAINANAGFYPVLIPNDNPLNIAIPFYGGFSKMLTVPAHSEIIYSNGAETRWATTTSVFGPVYLGAATSPGFNITGNYVTISGVGILSGPSQGVYVGNEIGIIAIGTSTGAPLVGIRIGPHLEIKWWGSDGIVEQFTKNFKVVDCIIHDCGYAGGHFLSCEKGQLIGNEVYNITPGASGNAYGLSLTADNSSDTTAGQSRSVPNRFCIGVEVAWNYIHDIPLWAGLDAHGAYDCHWHNNWVYNCLFGITCSSIPAGGHVYAGENNTINDNLININQANGSATTVVGAAPSGIIINGGGAAPNTYHIRPKVINNTIIGYGNNLSSPIPTAMSIQCTATELEIIEGNIIDQWSGFGIYKAAGFGGRGGSISRNIFGALASSYANDACIRLDGYTTPPIMEGNVHNITAGTAAHFGISVLASQPNILVGINDFAAAQTAPYGNTVGGALTTANFLGQTNPLVVGALGGPIVAKLKGTVAMAGTTAGVSFGVTLPAATYQVSLCANLTGGPFWVTSKATTGFTVNAGSSFTGNVDWIAEL